MAERKTSAGDALTFESFGVRVRLLVSAPEALAEVERLLPPGSRDCDSTGLAGTFELGGEAGLYDVSRDGELLVQGVALEVALKVLERRLHELIVDRAPEHIFVHAGVVAYNGSTLLIPGESHSGKTSLVAALVRAGATYYSDEFAPLDADGLVHPFAKPLSIRDERFMQVDHSVDSLGGVAGDVALPVGAVVVTSFEAGREWQPRRLSSGEAVLAVLAHTVPARSRAAEALPTIRQALGHAVVLEGRRGEADALAPVLLAELKGDR